MATVSRTKAREILHDGTVHGRPLTRKQRGFFGARASGAAMKGLRRAHQRGPHATRTQ